MRTDQQIVERIEALKRSDLFGFKTSDLVMALDAEHARPFCKEDADLSEWKPTARTPEEAKAVVLDYMPFAWEKANHCRGLSAMRAMDHMNSWVWLAEEDALLAALEGTDYTHYGKTHLRAICEHFGWDWEAWGRWGVAQ